MDWHHGFPPEDSLMMVPVSGRKEDVNSQGRYGLPVSCECFCRSVTAGRLPACVFCFLSTFGLNTCGRSADVGRLALPPCWLAAARGSGVTKSSGTRRSSLGGGHFAIGLFFGWPGSTIHARCMGAVGGCPDVTGYSLHNLIQQPNLGEL